MTKHHYVYHSYEEWGREYIGCRTCNCPPEEDTKYFGSFKDKTFFPTEKTILFVCETREEVLEIEIKLHDFFDVAVNPQFANQAKQTGTKFDRTGFTGEKHPLFGVPRTEEQKKAHSEIMSGKYAGENNPRFGVPHTEEAKKKMSVAKTGENHPSYGNTGALSPCSKAIIAIESDGTQRHYGSGCEAAREIGIPQSSLRYHLEIGHVLRCGKWKGWQFFFKNSENFSGVKSKRN